MVPRVVGNFQFVYLPAQHPANFYLWKKNAMIDLVQIKKHIIIFLKVKPKSTDIKKKIHFKGSL